MKKVFRILGAIVDRANPIVIKELRQAVQSRFIIAVLMLFLLINLGVMGAYLLFGEVGAENLSAGREVFTILFAILTMTCLVLVPMYCAVRLVFERGGANMDLLYITTIRPAAIVRGKFWAAMLVTILIFSACTPFLSFTYLLRGISLPSIFFLLGTSLIATAACISFGIFLACIRAGAFVAILLGLVLLAAAGLSAGGISGMSEEFTRYGLLDLTGTKEFLAATGTTLMLILTGMGFFYVLAVALLSPRSANRAIGIRIFLTIAWIAHAVIWGLWSYFEKHHGPMIIWLVGSLCMLCIALIIAISERESWSARVRRTIPRFALLRPLAFLFYSGSAGGTLWCSLMAIATVTFAAYWNDRFPSLLSRDHMIDNTIKVMGGIFLYAYCYSMTTVLLRMLLFRRLPHQFTGLIMILLTVLGCIVPMLILFLVSPRAWRYGDVHRFWMLTNPGILIEEEMRSRTLIFLGVWATIVTCACLPWFISQVMKFVPLSSTPAPAAAPIMSDE